MWAKTHVPFVKPSEAFILLLCYDESNLRGSKVTLEKLDDNDAIVHIESIFLKLYYASGQFRNQISHEDYISIYETIWHDRADKAGWNLNIIYDQDKAIFKFHSKQ